MSNFSNYNWAGGNRTGAITINNATNNLTLGNSSGITMTATLGDININNSSGATVISNSADVIALTTSANNIQLSAGSNLSLVGNGVSIQDNAAAGSGGMDFLSYSNYINISSAYGGVYVSDYSPVGVGVINLVAPLNDISLYSGNRVRVESSGLYGIGLIDSDTTGTGGGIALSSPNNPININAGRGISLSNSTANPINIRNDASTSGGVFINDVAPPFNGSILLASANNDVNIVSSNVGAGGVNLSAVGPAGNITLTTNGPASGVVISNIFTGGVGTLTVDAGNHLYWNGTFIA
jgi:hypothetical protein